MTTEQTDAEVKAWMDRSNLFNYVFNKVANVPQPVDNDIEQYLLELRLKDTTTNDH